MSDRKHYACPKCQSIYQKNQIMMNIGRVDKNGIDQICLEMAVMEYDNDFVSFDKKAKIIKSTTEMVEIM